MELKASDSRDLRNQLKTWGENAPDRLQRRGRQKDLERWVLNRLLRSLDIAGKITYPVSVSEDENPDFRVRFEESILGIEVTEAVDEKEQALWTREAREDLTDTAPTIRETDIHGPTRRSRTRACLERAYKKKETKCGAQVHALLIYLNTDSALFEKPEMILSWIEGIVPEDTRFQFVWLVSGTRVYELRRMVLLATLDRP